jgi:hypothetical protein
MKKPQVEPSVIQDQGTLSLSQLHSMKVMDQGILCQLKRDKYSTVTVKPLHLLTWDRFDLGFKLFFLRHFHIAPKFSKELYLRHIEAFTHGSFCEPNNPAKNSASIFLKEFLLIKQSIDKNGFDSNKSVVPIAACGAILNGSHRVACSILSNAPVTCLRTDISSTPFDHNFFRMRGVSDSFLDASAVEFIKHSLTVFVAIIWPCAFRDSATGPVEFDNVVYRKKLYLTENGVKNLLVQVYEGEGWLGEWSNKFRGVRAKLDSCFVENRPTEVVVFQAPSLKKVVEFKEKVRAAYGLGKHSIHITDSHSESVALGRILLNRNSVLFLNNGHPFENLKNQSTIEEWKHFIAGSEIGENEAMLAGSTPLAIFGLREANDVDVVFSTTCESCVLPEGFESHASQLKYYPETPGEMVSNPFYHFYFYGVKILSLHGLIAMKRKRGESKDLYDLAIIQSAQFDAKRSLRTTIFRKLATSQAQFRRWIRWRSRQIARDFLNQIGILDMVRIGLCYLRRDRKE